MSGRLLVTGGSYGLARIVVAGHGLDPDRLRAGSLAASGLERPANCALDSSRAQSLLRSRIRSVRGPLCTAAP